MSSLTDPAAVFQKAVSLHQSGKLNEAATLYRQLLEAFPQHGDTLYLLARIDLDQGRLASSEERIRQALAVDRVQAQYQHHLGQVLRSQGRYHEAITAYLEALHINPDFTQSHLGLAGAFHVMGALDEAEAAAREALRCEPNLPEAHYNLGHLFRDAGKYSDARNSFLKAIELRPEMGEAYRGLGEICRIEGKLEEAVAAYRRAIDRNPRDDFAHFLLGVALQLSGHHVEALATYRNAVKLKPNDADSYSNMGVILEELGEIDQAIEAHRRAIELMPQVPNAYGNLGICLNSQGRTEEALAAYRKAIELRPNEPQYQSNYLYTLLYQEKLDPAKTFTEHRLWGEQHADPLTAKAPPHVNDRSTTRRLRVGYVSAHFRNHAVNVFSEPILAAHDHSAFEIYCFSNVPGNRRDQTTERLHTYADHWREIDNMSDEMASQCIRNDQIDILVDLTGHIAGERLLVFARRPAPVQVTYLGYQATTGMRAMDYRLTDAWSDPPGMTETWHTEKLVRLPRTFFCYTPPREAPPVGSQPLATNGYVTFGSFNNFAKVTPRVLAAWGRLVHSVPNSRIVFLAAITDSLKQFVRGCFSIHGVDPHRIDFVGRQLRDRFMELLGRVDIALDPYPFNGHTTTCDALWMGTPVISLAGNSYVSRFGSSALVTLGLSDLVAKSEDEYLQIATSLAADGERLAQLRGTLRERIGSSALVDRKQFTLDIEDAYRQMWRAWSDG